MGSRRRKEKMEEERHVYAAGKDATVEVTVKVKKRRSPSRHLQEAPVKEVPDNFRKGSWGDLLSQHREAEVKKATTEKHAREKVGQKRELKCSEGRKLPGGACHMIPISENLYMETHTHLRTDRHGKGFTEKHDFKKDLRQHRSREEINKEMENEKLKLEIELLKREVEKVKMMQKESLQLRKKIKSAAPVSPGFIRPGKYGSKPRTAEKSASAAAAATTTFQPKEKKNLEELKQPRSRSVSPMILTESKGTSTTNINVGVSKKSEITQTDGKSPEKPTKLEPTRNVRLEQLELENLALKREAHRVYVDLQRAEKDHQDSIDTMKELYKTAESLKQENQELMAKQEQQQVIHEKLMDAVSENQELKKYLQTAVSTIENSAEKENELAHIRNVIEEVKSTIESEMQEINHNQSSMSFYEKPEMIRGFQFNISERESALLNDTNSSEIQRILGSLNQEVGQDAEVGENKTSSPRLSVDRRSFSPDEGSPESMQSTRSLQNADEFNLIKSVSKAFRPIQDELLNLSTSTVDSDLMV